jgi:hypothetical protein
MNIKTTNHAAYEDASASAEVIDANSRGSVDATAMMLLERAVLQADWRMQDQRDEWI